MNLMINSILRAAFAFSAGGCQKGYLAHTVLVAIFQVSLG